MSSENNLIVMDTRELANTRVLIQTEDINFFVFVLRFTDPIRKSVVLYSSVVDFLSFLIQDCKEARAPHAGLFYFSQGNSAFVSRNCIIQYGNQEDYVELILHILRRHNPDCKLI